MLVTNTSYTLCVLVPVINLRQPKVTWKEVAQLKVSQRGDLWGLSWLLMDAEEPRPLWVAPPLGLWPGLYKEVGINQQVSLEDLLHGFCFSSYLSSLGDRL